MRKTAADEVSERSIGIVAFWMTWPVKEMHFCQRSMEYFTTELTRSGAAGSVTMILNCLKQRGRLEGYIV